jgi:hypothetical protein
VSKVKRTMEVNVLFGLEFASLVAKGDEKMKSRLTDFVVTEAEHAT